MNLGAVIAMESTSVTFTRHAAGTRAGGIYTPGSTSTFAASFAVQPLTPRELSLLPEGERTKGKLKLYGTTELLVASPTNGRLGDRFTRGSVVWEVTAESDWDDVQGEHRRYYATMVEA